mmetsp:Transcript_15119/g.44576  ORF Transcript_15119/g.44576 Transcript_15119/m.44576 type:complete len:240 (+) Transcript_15119:768-1487(+)
MTGRNPSQHSSGCSVHSDSMVSCGSMVDYEWQYMSTMRHVITMYRNLCVILASNYMVWALPVKCRHCIYHVISTHSLDHAVKHDVQIQVRWQLTQPNCLHKAPGVRHQPSQIIDAVDSRVILFQRILKVALEVELLPRCCMRRDLQCAPTCTAAAFPVVFIIDTCTSQLQWQVNREDVDHLLYILVRQRTEIRSVFEVGGHFFDAQVLERCHNERRDGRHRQPLPPSAREGHKAVSYGR